MITKKIIQALYACSNGHCNENQCPYYRKILCRATLMNEAAKRLERYSKRTKQGEPKSD